MQQIIINWSRLFRYSLLFFVFSILVTSFILIWFSSSLEDLWNNGIYFSISQLMMSFELSLTLFIFVSFPVLLFRFMFFFSKMLYRGRKTDVGILNFKTLFNPLNFLFLPSLLNPLGIDYRRRCLISLILLISLYLLMTLLTS
jgi:hypothetical protein